MDFIRRIQFFLTLTVTLILLLGCSTQPTATPQSAPTQIPLNTEPAAGNEPKAAPTETMVLPAPTTEPTVEPKAAATSAPVAQGNNDFLKYVPGGPFKMGSSSDDSQAKKNEFPQHTLSLSSFWIFKGEVTNRMYKECVKAGRCDQPKLQQEGPSSFYYDPKYADWPVVGVDWTSAKAYCEYSDGRLPSEAEWEKAARGLNGDLYPWGSSSPSCDLLNMNGCKTNPPTTEQVSHYPSGASPYQVMDMAGNVREWVNDFYLDTYYSRSPGWDPQGPVDGSDKVIRGGGYKDGPENERSAVRFHAQPTDSFSDVGFRCVKTGKAAASAPFCKATYPPFCLKPEQASCGGAQTQAGAPLNEPVVTQVDCPAAGTRTKIYISTNFPSTVNVTISVNGNPFYVCKPNTGYPGRVICTGSMPVNPVETSIKICQGSALSPGAQSGGLVPVSVNIPSRGYGSTKQLFRPSLANYLVSVSQAGVAFCPDGFRPNTSGGCEPIPADKCPDGWRWRAQLNRCIPSSARYCPVGTTYGQIEINPFCLPEGEQCPGGYQKLIESGLAFCYPIVENTLCPKGYRFNQQTNCCESIPQDNLGCQAGTYFNTTYNRCIPVSGDGCSYGKHFDYNQGCVDDFKPDGTLILETSDAVKDTCPWPLVDDQKSGCSYPPDYKSFGPDYTSTQECNPGEILENGACVPANPGDQKTDCGTNGQFIPALSICGFKGTDGCGVGYYKDSGTNKCLPVTGLGSRCAYGYVFNPKNQCCLPVPGNMGSTCPRPVGVSILSAAVKVVGAGTKPFWSNNFPDLMRAANYNPLIGLCMPDSAQKCPPGYTQGANNCVIIPWSLQGCPAGTIPDDVHKVCRPSEAGKCPVNTTLDTSDNTCKPSPAVNKASCSDNNQYLDNQLMVCEGRTSDCCQPGYKFDSGKNLCVPIVITSQPPAGISCGFGAQWNEAQNRCTAIGGEGEAVKSCYTIQMPVPDCNGPCPDPMVWDGRFCVQSHTRPLPEGHCGQWASLDTCRTNECNWNPTTLKCVNRCDQLKSADECNAKDYCLWNEENNTCHNQ